MKKVLSIVFAVIALSFFGIESKAQVAEGTKLVDAYYGYSLSSSFWKSAEMSNALETKYSGLGPIGIRFEYMVTDIIGLGVDANYRNSEFTQKYDVSGSTYSSKYSVVQTRIMGRMNFHVTKTEKVDYYLGFGLGYKSSSRKFVTTDPNSVSVDFPPLPVAFRISTGLRYFFTQKAGIHFEVGVGGGSIATAGFSFKF